MRIQNPEIFTASAGRQLALQLIEAGLEAIDTKQAIERAKDKFIGLPVAGGKLIVVGVGKCALDAASALEEILGDQITGGVVIDVRPAEESVLKRLRYFQGDHPFPTQRNVVATGELLGCLRGLSEQDTVLAIVSGGGSTLLAEKWEEESKILKELFAAGTTIGEINKIRKQLSSARAGGVARAAAPARVVGLIFSDVPGNDLNTIASAPTILDSEKVENHLIVSNTIALEAMRQAAQTAGWQAEIVTDRFAGEAEAVARQLLDEQKLMPAKSVRLYGGELTVKIIGQGEGGRNQHLALAALRAVAENALIISLASDGHDNSAFAGGICDKISSVAALAAGLSPEDYLARNDSYNFFQRLGHQIITGPTGANVSDLIINLKE